MRNPLPGASRPQLRAPGPPGECAADGSRGAGRSVSLRGRRRSRETRTRGPPRRHHQGHTVNVIPRAWARAVPDREIARMRADFAKSVEDDEAA